MGKHTDMQKILYFNDINRLYIHISIKYLHHSLVFKQNGKETEESNEYRTNTTN
jgi:hypothetical protein